jgi:hypothetical protein
VTDATFRNSESDNFGKPSPRFRARGDLAWSSVASSETGCLEDELYRHEWTIEVMEKHDPQTAEEQNALSDLSGLADMGTPRSSNPKPATRVVPLPPAHQSKRPAIE